SVGATWKVLLGNLAVVSPFLHGLQHGAGAPAITARRYVIGHEGCAELLFHNFPAGEQRFGHTDSHLRIIGVADFLLGMGNQRIRGWKAGANRVPRLRFEFATQGVADGKAEQASTKTILEFRIWDRHDPCPRLFSEP